MDKFEQVNIFNKELSRRMDSLISELDLSYAEAIGVLEMLKLNLYMRARVPKEDVPESDEGI